MGTGLVKGQTIILPPKSIKIHKIYAYTYYVHIIYIYILYIYTYACVGVYICMCVYVCCDFSLSFIIPFSLGAIIL